MRHVYTLFLSICLCLSCQNSSESQSTPQVQTFKDGDRVAFFGDSITHQGRYHSYIWLFYMTRFPYMQLDMYNVGIGGDTADNLYYRIEGDALSLNPTVMLVNFGMNDTGYDVYGSDGTAAYIENQLNICASNYGKIVQTLLQHPEIRVIGLSSTPYDETAQIGNLPLIGKDSAIIKVNQMHKESAEKQGWEFIDLHTPLWEVTKSNQKLNPSYTLTLNDRIHPDNHGDMLMAYEFLKAQGLDNSKVADIHVDAAQRKILMADNCKIGKLRVNDSEISFSYLAKSLPYPLNPQPCGWRCVHSQSEIDDLAPFTEQMNQELLRVTGLVGRYELRIDGKTIAEFDAEQLGGGVNMAELHNTPQYQQARAIMVLNEWRWDIEHDFRELALMQYTFLRPYGLTNHNDNEALAKVREIGEGDIWLTRMGDYYENLTDVNIGTARADEMRFLRDRIYQINKPKKHFIQLIKLQHDD